MARFPDWSLALIAALCSLAFYAYIPSLGAQTYASPDETATAVAAERLVAMGSAAISEQDALAAPWLHPRSWVTQGETMVPVGFLGLPWIASWFVRVFGTAVLPWFGAVFWASAAIPLFFLLRRFGRLQALLAVTVAMTMPNAVLYGNRGLFPNAPLVACVVWGVWLTFYASRNTYHVASVTGSGLRATGYGLWVKDLVTVFAGFFWALALAIRPVEAVWILPWFVWAVTEAKWKVWTWALASIGALVVFVGVELVVHATYGQWIVIGYWLRDNPLTLARQAFVPITTAFRLTPFGLHPLNIARNAVGFLGGILVPWTLLGLTALGFLVRRYGRRLPVVGLLALWTAGWLILFYGNGRYLDHVIPGAVTIGNSYLRYLLPLVPLVALAFAWLAQTVLVGRGSRAVLMIITAALVCVGLYRATIADDEGVWYTRRELVRYERVREKALETFGPGAVVFSERSDKIFFPALRGVSPEPSMEQMAALIRAEKKDAGWFTRPPTQDERDTWRKYGIEVQDVSNEGRENLYRLHVRP